MRESIIKPSFYFFFIFSLFFVFHSVAYAQDEVLIEKAAQDGITQAISSLLKTEKAAKVERIAIYPLEIGENTGAYDQAMTDLLTIALSKTRYRVILRQELLKVMQEHGFVLGKVDLFNPDSVKKLGGFLGVDAIVFGTIKETSANLEGAIVRLNLKMADVTTGELVWGESISGAVGKPKSSLVSTLSYFISKNINKAKRLLLTIFLIICLVLVLKLITRRTYSFSKSKAKLGADSKIRDRIVSELGRTLSFLRDTRDIANKNSNTNIVSRLKDVSNSLDSLKLEVDNAAFGNVSMLNKKSVSLEAASRMIELDKSVNNAVIEVAEMAKELFADITSSKIDNATAKIQELEKKIGFVRNKFKERTELLNG